MTAARATAIVGALLGWLALDLQLAVSHVAALARGTDFVTVNINFFSYFTILSNIFAALVLTAAAFNRHGALSRFLRHPVTTTAVALYMGVTGVIYGTILHALWQPVGLAWVADSLLHYVMPALYVLFWLVFLPKAGLRFGHVIVWMIFPVVYALYSLVRGAAMGFYPYPFVDVSLHGYPTVWWNIVILSLAFAILGVAVVGVSRALARR